jgi:hypothetical protein
MIELDRNGVFARAPLGVDAALSAAHAISTHEINNEVDYFTAVDDLPGGTGAAHPDEAQIASACFYKYFCLDWEQLLYNLTPSKEKRIGQDGKWDPNSAPDEVKRLAAATLGHFLIAAAKTTPSGKQKSSASYCMPDGILVEIKKEGNIPTSYANAFADAVPQKSQRGLVGHSIAQLGQYVHEIAEGYGLKAERYWFSPAGRYKLTWCDSSAKESEKDKPVVKEQDGNLTNLDQLVMKVIACATGRRWEDVRDAGKTNAEAKP